MKIYIEKKKLKENLYNLMRRCGYRPFNNSYVRPVTNSNFNYPRFHLHIKEVENQYILNLHLDQKKPSYGKEVAHSGEYETGTVEKEAERITKIIEELK